MTCLSVIVRARPLLYVGGTYIIALAHAHYFSSKTELGIHIGSIRKVDTYLGNFLSEMFTFEIHIIDSHAEQVQNF